MSAEFRSKVFRSGNSLALRLPKGLGAVEGTEMVLREERLGFKVEPVPTLARKIDLTGIYGSIPDLARVPVDDIERDWDARGGDGG